MKKPVNPEMVLVGNEIEKFTDINTGDYIEKPVGKTFLVAKWYINMQHGYHCDTWGYVNNIIFEILQRDAEHYNDFYCRLVAIL